MDGGGFYPPQGFCPESGIFLWLLSANSPTPGEPSRQAAVLELVCFYSVNLYNDLVPFVANISIV
jgi:hypothetical protein